MKAKDPTGTVAPHSFSGWNWSPAQMFGSGPKMTITCGACRLTFQRRIPMVDNPGIACPKCQTVNVLPLRIEQ